MFFVVVEIFNHFFKDNAVDILEMTNSGLGFAEIA